MRTKMLTVRVERERLSNGEPIYVALCLELDLACQGATVDEAVKNVTDAVESFFEVASPSEIERRVFTIEEIERLSSAEADRVFITRIEVPFGKTADLVGA